MLRNFFITALRNHIRFGAYTAISVAGLMLGMAVATLVFLHVWQETHYDRHLPDADRLHIVELTLDVPGRSLQELLIAPGPLGPAASESIAGVEAATRLWQAWYTLSVGDRLKFNHPIVAADPNAARMLGLDMLEGSVDALKDPSAVLVSTTMAERLFGQGPYLGQQVSLDDYVEVEIAGVYADMPSTSHLDEQFIIALESPAVRGRGVRIDTDWSRAAVYTYLRLAPSASPVAVGEALQNLARQNMRAPDGTTIESAVAVALEAVTDLHLNGKTYVRRPGETVGSPTALVIAATVAALVLIVACINSINIATARSTDRAHEVGLRKVVGASRWQLIVQFLGESALLVLLATIGALVIAEVAAAAVGDFIGRELIFTTLLQPGALLVFFLLVVAVVLLSGLYPAFVLASFKPARIFQPVAGRSGLSLRSVLVVFQFATSIALMVLAGTVWQQVRYLESADLGFDRKDIVQLPGVRRDPAGTIALTRRLGQALEGRPGIVHVSGTHSSPSWDYADEAQVRPATAAADANVSVDRLAVDLDFFDVLRVAPVAGRVFDEQFGPDRAQWDLEARREVELPLVVNLAAVNSLGFGEPNALVGEVLRLQLEPGYEREGRVIGVVPDFHFKSLKSRIRPMVFFPDPTRFNVMLVRINSSQRDAAMTSIEQAWQQTLPGQAISQNFLDRDLVNQYVSEQRQFSVLAGLAGIAVFIAMLGLVGLLAHAVTARRREVSIRKVLGAENGDVLKLFLWQFSRPVLIAAVIAGPIAWLLAERWLSSFAYRIDVAWWLFAAAGGSALVITWLLTALQVVKVSRTRPARVLQARAG
ncbi:MAG: FtsX-like permease family protein [Pseudomonadota bacterium]